MYQGLAKHPNREAVRLYYH